MGTDRKNRIGLFGGSFDPIHRGHLLVAQAAVEELELDSLFFIPAARSPFKPDSKPIDSGQRARLIRLALAGHPDYGLDLQEIDRGGISYTIDTVRGYTSRYPGAEIHYLIGDDHVAKLRQWKDSEQLAALVRFAIIPRPGEAGHAVPHPFTGQRLKGWPMEVSSSGIRERVRAGLPIDHLVPGAVAEAIANNRLYL